MRQLSILIPARNEMFLTQTVKDILSNIEADTEIIVVLDGLPAVEPLPIDKRLTVITLNESIGQRASTNLACKLSQAKYVMKVDAHCAFDKGFDRKLIENMQDNWTVVPTMKNLHVFDWKCMKCGKRTYQGPTPTSCADCPNTTDFKRKILWRAKDRPLSTSYCFDSEPHFQYFKEYPFSVGELTESMSIQGSCFMLTREKYIELNICDEELGSWGSQGIEVACKTWLSGGKVIINQKTWYAHMFRTQGGDFGFPYHLSGKQIDTAKTKIRDLFFNNKWEKQIYPLSWLVEKFNPPEYMMDKHGKPKKCWTREEREAIKNKTL